jgi:hypothetical protein
MDKANGQLAFLIEACAFTLNLRLLLVRAFRLGVLCWSNVLQLGFPPCLVCCMCCMCTCLLLLLLLLLARAFGYV